MSNTNRDAAEVLSIGQVIENKGYFDIHGEWNSIIRSRKYPDKLFRGRVEVFIFKGNMIYIETYPSGSYRIPGGSFDVRRSNHDQVYNEAKEEARIIIKNIHYTGHSYHKFRDKPYISKDNKTIAWDGTYNKIYTADFAGYYNGPVKSFVQDASMYAYGRFLPLENVWCLLSDDHKVALQHKVARLRKQLNNPKYLL